MKQQQDMTFDLEVEPEEQGPEVISQPGGAAELALVRALPTDFPLMTLLQFLPDVGLKAALQAKAEAATAVDVTAEGGMEQADAALTEVRASVAHILGLFDGTEAAPGPTALANTLHKRLTGLRKDWVAAGVEAITLVGQRILDEKRRRDRMAAEVARKAQQEADAKAKADARQAATDAKAAGVAPAVVKQMREAAKTATAPPVSVPATSAGLRGSTVAVNWKSRPVGTLADDDPNPLTRDMTPAQQASLLVLLRAIVDGDARVPLAMVNIDWSYANRRAGGDRATFEVPGLEAYDAGSLRGKGRRR